MRLYERTGSKPNRIKEKLPDGLCRGSVWTMKSTTSLSGPLFLLLFFVGALGRVDAAEEFEGRFFRGRGDVGYLRLLDTARRLFAPDPEFQNLAMLYRPDWNGLVEGPTWDAWWIQNSYGTTHGILPLLQEPFVTFLQNAQDLWFDQMGDGKRVGAKPPFDWVAPDGCLCDAARPGRVVYKQGDGRVGIYDSHSEVAGRGSPGGRRCPWCDDSDPA